MKKSALYIFALTLLLQQHTLHAQQQVINGFSMPENVTSARKRFFVSNQGQDPMSKDADGFISEIAWAKSYI